MGDMLIRGGIVIDGTGEAARPADVRVRGGKIVEVASGLASNGEAVVEADGAFVTPGFIDTHTHYDASIYWDPVCDPMPQHGVTSVLIGNCSLGLAPLRPADRSRLVDLFSYIEDIPQTAFESAIDWTWETFGEYADAMRTLRLGVNVGTLVSHSLLRLYVMGEDAWHRAATAAEAQAIALELRRSLEAGALGMSGSEFDKDRGGNRVPCYFADDQELDLLFQELGARGALYEFVHSSQAALNDELAWIAEFSRRHNVVVIDNALLQLPNNPAYAPRAVAQLQALNEAGARVYAMMSPRRFDIDVNFDSSLCFIKLPVWNEIIQVDRPAKRTLLADPDWQRRARQEFDSCQDSPLFPVYRIGDIRILAVGKDEYEDWVGQSFGDLAAARGGHPADVLGQWLLDNDFDCRFLVSVGNTDPALLGTFLKAPQILVSGSDAGAHLQMFCAVGDTTLFLTEYVRDKKVFSWEDGIHQLTGRQADLLNVGNRGRIAVGMAADLVIFRPEELHYAPEIVVNDLPGDLPRLTRGPGGYRYTIVNGEVVQANGTATGALPARYLEPQLA